MKYLITGGTGSLGSALVKRLIKDGLVSEIRVYSRDEFKQSEMARNLNSDKVTYWLGDVRDLERLKEACKDVTMIIHTAAMKRMDTISRNAYEVADVNINGTRNVMIAANGNNVIFISSDKAYNPTCIYGATKMVAEGIVLADPFSTVWRFGNFIGSRGSVWKIFEEQKKTGILTLTDPKATRFVMTIQQACSYILNGSVAGLHYPKNLMSMSVQSIAESIAPDAEYKIIGLREGEKLHEAFSEDYVSNNNI